MAPRSLHRRNLLIGIDCTWVGFHRTSHVGVDRLHNQFLHVCSLLGTADRAGDHGIHVKRGLRKSNHGSKDSISCSYNQH